MEFNELNEALRDSLSYSWSMYLLKFNKKTKMYQATGISLNRDYFKNNLEDYLNWVIDKVASIQGVIPYTEGILSKGYYSFVKSDDERVCEAYTKFIESITNANIDVMNSYNGYILKGVSDEGKEILLVNTTNPIVTLKDLMITPQADEFSEPFLIKLTKRIDCIVTENQVVGDALKLEALFGMDSTSRAICESNRKAVIESKLFNEASTALLMNPRIIRSYQNVDMMQLEALKNKENSSKLKPYAEFEYTVDGTLHLLTNRSVRIMLQYLNGKIVERDGAYYVASSLKPLVKLEANIEEDFE